MHTQKMLFAQILSNIFNGLKTGKMPASLNKGFF